MSGYQPVQRFLRRHTQSDRFYSLLRRGLLVAQFVTRRPDEPDFRVFQALGRGSAGGLVIDVGANAGQSAVAFAFTCPSHQILSFEPNPALQRDLAFVKRLLGGRFEFRGQALGASAGEVSLFVPHIGLLPVSTRASVSRAAAEAHGARLEAEVGRTVEVREIQVPVVTLDELGLRPDAIKIDVEGHELGVLSGGLMTIRECQPLLMIEENAETPRCQDLLTKFGYSFFRYDRDSKRLTNDPASPTRNWFAVPPDDQMRRALHVAGTLR